MEIAEVVSRRSTCQRRQIGAVIVKGKQIVSTGYNGAPAGHPHCGDVGCAREDVPSGERSELCRAAHAEQNAINFAARYGIPIEGATIYSTTYPCSWCAKSIVNAGLTRVVFKNDYPDALAKEILSIISVVRFVPHR
jgi:dCMP deaminase